MKIKHLAIALLSLPLAFSCTQLVETVPESSPVVEFGSPAVSVPASESSVTVALSANCDWTASSSVNWIQVAPQSGTRATTVITLAVAENTVEETPRSGQVTVSANGVSATLTVNQAAPAGPVPPGTELYTADDFKAFLELAKDFTPNDVTKIFNDIDMGGATIAPIGVYNGVLDGQGHKVYNFKVEAAGETTGLFLVNNGTIKNIVFGSADGVKYDGVSQIAAASGQGGSSTGLVAVNMGTLDNVTSFATVKFVATSAASAKFGVGGLVGTAAAGAESASVVRNCSNRAAVMASGTLVVETSFGGVVGYVSSAGTVIENCSNDTDFSISVPVKKVVMMGGVLGRTDAGGTFTKLVNNGEVSYVQEEAPSTWMSIGGVIGTAYNGAVITEPVNNAPVSSNHQQVVRMGGIMGVMNTGGKISGAVNNAPVTLTQTANGNWQAVGGILGFQEKSGNNNKDNIITGSTNKGNVTVTLENTTTHANRVSVGGIIGAGALQLSVTNNTNLGAVSVTNAASGAVYAGGIYGGLYKHSAEIEASGNVNAGKVSASTSDNALAYAGGVVGYLAPASGGDANKVTLTLVNEKNTGDVVCGNAAGAGSIAGLNGNGKLVDSQVGGSVNGVAVTAANLASLIQGSASTGSVENPTALNGGPVDGKGLKNAEDLKAFMTATDYAEWTEDGVVKVLADIDASSIESLQIAEIKEGVVIDGMGHNIYNIKSVSQAATTGLILVNNGTVKNLNFGTKDGLTYDGVSVITSTEGKGGYFTGLVAENNGTLEGITTFATVNFVAGSASKEIGVSCLVGHAGEKSLIKGCVNKATLNASGNVPQITDFGTIVGFMDGAEAQVINCSNEAKQTYTLPVKKVLHIGGLVGRINAVVTVENCQNKADIAYDQAEAPSTWMSIGGVIGSDYNGGTVSGCTNTGSVSANTLQVVRIGGIMGVLNKSGVVTGCTNEGAVTLTQAANANWQSAGGIIGFQEASQTNDKDNVISNNTNKGPVTVTVENTTTHANKVAAGGILGEGCLALSVTGNTNSAAVKVTNAATGAVYAGGIFGALIKNKQEILSSGNINTGSVSAATSDNDLAMAGGVVGYVAPASGGDANTVVLTLSGEKNTGAVTAGNAEMAGSIAGNNATAKLQNCIAGGSVNGKAVTEANLADLVQGAASKGEATGTTLAK